MEIDDKTVTDKNSKLVETNNSQVLDKNVAQPLQEKAIQVDSEQNSDKPKKSLINFFKTVPGIITVAVVISCIIISIVLFNKYTKEKEYEKNLKEFIMESGKASMASAMICDDLRSVWHDYIFEDKEYFDQSTGQFSNGWGAGRTYCSDFSEAVHKKIEWNKKHLPSSITEPYYKAKRLYKDMTPPPSKYKEAHAYVKQMFKAMERLQTLSDDPTGNYATYSSNCNQAVEEYTSSLSDLTNECDIDFSKVGTNENEEDEFED